MADRLAFLLFGDQSLDTYAFLAGLYRTGNQGILAKAFLHQAGEALRIEVEQLGRLERAKLPVFKTLQQLNERYHAQGTKHPGIDGALLCVTQLAHYIDHAEKNYEDVTKHDRTFLVGLCSGLFAAAAIASTPSLSALVPVAVQAVLMAFRTGVHVASLADRLCPPTDKSESWTYIFANQREDDVRRIVSDFCRSNTVPQASAAYISAASSSSVAISGPPTTLKKLVATGNLGRYASIPVHGPYHAAHLYADTDIKKILRLDDPSVVDAFYKTQPRSAVMSCATGKWFDVATTEALFEAAVNEILNEPLLFGRVLDGCLDVARACPSSGDCLVVPFGPTQNANTLASLVRSKTGLEVTLRPSPDFSATASTITAVPAKIGNHGNVGKCKLAVVGMAGRFPDAASHEKLWELLAKGLDVHRVVPPDRFPAATHVDPTGKSINTSHTPYGCWIEKPGLFDPRFFNMSPREALQTDPMQRMALTTAYEALEMSGYVPNRTPSTRLDRIGTFYGQTSDDWREINAAQEVDTYFITGGVRAFGPGRINYHFGFSGPSLNIDTACSSSAAAMNVACTALWARDCDTAIVGGLSCMTNSDIFAGLSRGQFLSKTGPCATFDNGADGYCRGDGCASVIVKRLEDAEADGDNILAVILGTSTNHSADAISITHPHGPTQSILSSAILDEAGVDPLDVDYVEMHGTGTQAGDGTEMLSVTNVFAPADRKRPADRPLYLGAVKANIGHGEAASGVTALIKVLLMMQKNSIPPHVGIKKEMNKGFPVDLSERNVNIAFHMTPFRRLDGKPRRVFVNNFSAAGGNTGLLLEDGPRRAPAVADPRSSHVVTITAKSKAAMIRNAERLVAWMAEHPDTPLADVAYTTTARRIQHYWRMNVTASDLADAQRALQARLQENFVPVLPEQPKVAFMFTGQGSHYAGLGKEFYAHFSVFRDSIDEFDKLAKVHGFPSFLPLIDGSEPDVQALSPVVVQLGLACFEMALARLWASWGIRPAVVLGHSLGEYAALNVAGVLSASDTIYLVGARARLLVDKCTAGTHAMLAVQGSVATVTDALGAQAPSVNIACINGPRETVLSGEAGQMAEIAQQLGAAGFKCTQLKVPFAFHSAQVDPILDDFEALARAVTFQPPQIPVISPLLGKLVGSTDGGASLVDPAYLRNHARDAVNFLGSLVSAQQSGAIDEKTVWLEIGPHPVCANMVKAAFGATTIAVPTLRRSEAAYKTLATSLCTLHSAGLNVDWHEYHRDFSASTRLLDLPSYSFDEKNYWLQYEGDWSLIKNRFAKMLPQAAGAATGEPAKPKLSTTSVHKIVREEVKGDVVTLETESDLCRADLRRALEGHLVNNTPLCPSTLYADMAMTIGDYAYKLVRPDGEPVGMNISDVEVPKTLIFDDAASSQILRVSATAHIAKGYADLVFHTGEGKKRTDHATCKVYYGDLAQWNTEFERVNYLIRGRIEALQEGEEKGTASKIGRGLAYKLFTALVDYAPRYRGMEEVILDSDKCEATAKVRFQTTEEDGQFFFNPYWIDSMCHISGFIVNGTDAVDSREQIYISHGWGSLRFLEKPDATKTYRSYIRMQPVKDTKMFAGDAYVFDGDRIIGVCGDVRFQAIPRKVLNLVLPPRGAAGAASSAAPAAARAATTRSAVVPASSAIPAAAVSAKAKNTKVVTHANIAKVNQKLTSVVTQVLDILAKEVGVSNDELADNIAFGDLGVDSLMSLTVSGRIREDLDVDLHSNAFVDHPTIGAFKKYLAQFETAGRKDSEATTTVEDSGASSAASETDGMKSDSGVTTPMEESDNGSVKDEGEGGAPAAGDVSSLQKAVRDTIASEMGVEVEEIVAAPDLANLGMDSLMSLQILGTLREKTGLNIPPDLFVSNTSLKAVERCLGIESRPPPPPPKRASLRAVTAAAPAPAPVAAASLELEAPITTVKLGQQIRLEPADPIVKLPPPTRIVDHFPHRKATSVLLQGSHRTATHNLFMIPDGSGCATSYTEISELGGNWAVWGLFSPFMKTPEEYNCGVYGMAAKFIDEIKRRQPEGPYNLSGWSAGGVIAYEIVNQLTKAGEVVDNVVFIDSPCPVTIEPLPKGLHAWFASIGLLGDGDPDKVPSWLLPHFAASVTALSNYTAEPIPEAKCPKVTVIWCEDGVCNLPTDPRPEPYPDGHALFLLDNRTDFGPNRWDEYLDVRKMTIRHMPGNHFSMMHGDLAKQLGALMREGLGL
ncbi:polyketide synthase [Niveomyces insectorum RCEF 264]|uniref:Polyketide synthase n=1 Tax=Niveomyces insectorum RCEF 264 TaxID=1081102 RepID=A0A167US15_9HYPO|nr:polyketide synthase [Niveomyces insectorum RCEF 264]